jgi:hypothetical protein
MIVANDYNVYLFGKPLKSLKFTACFYKMQVGGGIGFADSKLKSSSYIANEPNVVTYRNDATCRTGTETKEKVGKIFKQCQDITVSIDQE